MPATAQMGSGVSSQVWWGKLFLGLSCNNIGCLQVHSTWHRARWNQIWQPGLLLLSRILTSIWFALPSPTLNTEQCAKYATNEYMLCTIQSVLCAWDGWRKTPLIFVWSGWSLVSEQRGGFEAWEGKARVLRWHFSQVWIPIGHKAKVPTKCHHWARCRHWGTLHNHECFSS